VSGTPATVPVARAVVEVQEQLRNVLMHQVPTAEGWTLRMHPKTWYRLIQSEGGITALYQSGFVSKNVIGDFTLLDIPIALDPDWPERSISLRYEQVVVG
jgi:hypothetical protein